MLQLVAIVPFLFCCTILYLKYYSNRFNSLNISKVQIYSKSKFE